MLSRACARHRFRSLYSRYCYFSIVRMCVRRGGRQHCHDGPAAKVVALRRLYDSQRSIGRPLVYNSSSSATTPYLLHVAGIDLLHTAAFYVRAAAIFTEIKDKLGKSTTIFISRLARRTRVCIYCQEQTRPLSSSWKRAAGTRQPHTDVGIQRSIPMRTKTEREREGREKEKTAAVYCSEVESRFAIWPAPAHAHTRMAPPQQKLRNTHFTTRSVGDEGTLPPPVGFERDTEMDVIFSAMIVGSFRARARLDLLCSLLFINIPLPYLPSTPRQSPARPLKLRPEGLSFLGLLPSREQKGAGRERRVRDQHTRHTMRWYAKKWRV